MKTISLILIVTSLVFAGKPKETPIQITSDINNIFTHNHKSLGEFEKIYGYYTKDDHRETKVVDVLTREVSKTYPWVLIYNTFTFSEFPGKKIIIELEIDEDHSGLKDHQIIDIVIFIDGKPNRHHIKK